MTVFLWTNFVLGCVGLLCNATLISANKTTTTTPSERVGLMLVSLGFLVWVGVLLFGGAQ